MPRLLHQRTLPSRWSRLSVLLVFSMVACSSRRPPQSGFSNAEALDDYANSYVRLSIDLGLHDPDSLDYNIAAPAIYQAEFVHTPSLQSVDGYAGFFAAGLPRLSGPTALEAQRQRFLALQFEALKARLAMLQGHLLPFDEEAKKLFATTRLPDTSKLQRARIRAEIATLLPPGGKGSLAARLAAYNARFVIPPRSEEPVLRAALQLCRSSTARFVSLPPGEHVDLAWAHDRPWAAFSRYMGNGYSVLTFNADLPLTVDDALELACHEAYPGHHTFNLLHESALARSRHLPEALVQPTFSPQSYLSEAAAAYAPTLAFSPYERTRLEQSVLFPLAGIPAGDVARYLRITSLARQLGSAQPGIAQRFLDGKLEFVRAEQELEDETLMLHSEHLLLYLNQYRSYMLAYTDGPQRIRAWLAPACETVERVDEKRCWARFLSLSTSLESPFAEAAPSKDHM